MQKLDIHWFGLGATAYIPGESGFEVKTHVAGTLEAGGAWIGQDAR
jgi:hypothetical protein